MDSVVKQPVPSLSVSEGGDHLVVQYLVHCHQTMTECDTEAEMSDSFR